VLLAINVIGGISFLLSGNANSGIKNFSQNIKCFSAQTPLIIIFNQLLSYNTWKISNCMGKNLTEKKIVCHILPYRAEETTKNKKRSWGGAVPISVQAGVSYAC
jgi:hypothetical protein